MQSFSTKLQESRKRNARSLAAFGVQVADGGGLVRTVREGTGVTLFTVGYEKRDGEELMALLREHGIKALADVRERPMSRKPDFRAAALKAFCDEFRIEYQSWSCLGSTVEQRDELQESGDFAAFAKDFRTHAKRTMRLDIERLAASIQKKPTVLLCYERDHFDCHRSVIADLVADEIDANVLAI